MSATVAIVAGGGSPLGHATAVALAADGLTVVAVDRTEHALSDLPEDIWREVAEATDPALAAPLIDRIAGEVGPPDVLVNTIGAFRPEDTLITTPEMLRLMLDVNLGPALWLTQAMAPYMRQQGSGAIVHVAARPGIEPTSGMAAYSASKAALVHLTRILDIELRPHGIRVNAVAPQLLDTPRNRAMFPAEVMAHAAAPEAIAGGSHSWSATPPRRSAGRYCRRTAPNEADPARRTCRAEKIGWAPHRDPAEPATLERPARPRPGGRVAPDHLPGNRRRGDPAVPRTSACLAQAAVHPDLSRLRQHPDDLRADPARTRAGLTGPAAARQPDSRAEIASVPATLTKRPGHRLAGGRSPSPGCRADPV